MGTGPRPHRAAGRVWSTLLFALLAALLLALPAAAQTTREAVAGRSLGLISGRIFDMASGVPLALAQVYLEPIRDPTALRSGGGSPSSVRATHAVTTREDGSYSFPGLAAGAYRLHVQRPGYQTSVVDVELGAGAAHVSLGLEFNPVRLAPIEIVADPPQPYTRTFSAAAEAGGARRTVAHDRQAAYLESDVRALSAGDVLEAVTLAESDLFRAMQRLPGVSRRDDYTAVLWTRGAPWVQTRVYFDGMPLYNPTHGGWLFTSINPDGVGEANFHPGVRSVAWGEGAAGIVDLQSRRGGDGIASGRAELSLASARFGADGALPGGIRWMVAGRRTYVDVLTRALDFGGVTADTYIPYDFADGIARVDIPLPFGMAVEASGIGERDRLRGDIANVISGNEASWGNRAGRVTLRAPLGPLHLSGTYGSTRFAAQVDEREIRGRADTVPTLSALESAIGHDRASVRIDGDPDAFGGVAWAFGMESIDERLRYEGPFSLTGEGIPGLPRVHFELTPTLQYQAYWGETRLKLFERLELQGGLRVEAGDSLRNLRPIRAAPRISARWWPTRELLFSAAWGRSFQYTQAIGASAGPLGPQLHLSHLWILAARGYPALVSEIATFGAEKWVDDNWLLAVNTYSRHVTGITDPDPTPGPIRSDASHVEADNVARGVELSARRLMGRWTTGLGYAYGTSRMEMEDLRFPAAADIRHTLDLTSAYRLNDGLRLGGAFSMASGVPYTRIVMGEVPRLEDPGARRTRDYASLDVMVDYTARYRDWDVGAYLQVVNLLGRANAVTYAGSHESCPQSGPLSASANCANPLVVDDFTSGLPRLPLFGFRIGF